MATPLPARCSCPLLPGHRHTPPHQQHYHPQRHLLPPCPVHGGHGMLRGQAAAISLGGAGISAGIGAGSAASGAMLHPAAATARHRHPRHHPPGSVQESDRLSELAPGQGGHAHVVLEESLEHRAALCDSGLPDPDMCLLSITEEAPPRELSVAEEAASRGRWLLGLLVLQSSSSFVLDQYQDLLRDHLVVTLFLTMLVGAGGNAGNQSAIKVIRGLATDALDDSWPCIAATLAQQARVGLLLGAGLAAAGFVRVYITNGDALNAAAISLSLLAIVLASVVIGAALPFGLTRAGVDPAHGGTTVQVVMDILGCAITCALCNLLLVQLAAGLAPPGATPAT